MAPRSGAASTGGRIMADSVEEALAEDPVAQFAHKHLLRMQEIANESFEKAKEITTHASQNIRRYGGLRATVIEKLLETKGLMEPPPTADAATDAPTE